MKEQFVSYEIASKLKELGFDEECLGDYYIIPSDKTPNPNGEFLGLKYEDVSSYTRLVSAPLWQQVIDWLRKKYNIHIEIELTDNTMVFYYQYCIVDSKNRECHNEDMIDQATRRWNYNSKYKTYEEAREQAILKVIELIKKIKH